MSAASKVNAIQAAMDKTVKAARAEYAKRNPGNKAPAEHIEKIIRSRLNAHELVEAFVADALDSD